ncbi:MAG: single-stranded DNA-binding protein [Elusimicrobiota bacterium]|nr:single-stranded DNA-binding protein [Elusimicrobiota bacterium]
MVQKIRLPNLNIVVLVGRVIRDFELRYTQKGQAVCRFDVAVSRRFKDSAGNWQEEASYVPVVVWRDAAQRCSERLKKGSPVQIVGRLRTRSWEDKDGKKRTALEVETQRIQFLEFEELPEEIPAVVEQETMGAEEVIPVNKSSSSGKLEDEEVPF